MPVTVTVVDHSATEWKQERISTSEQLLKKSCPEQHRRCRKLVQSSFDDLEHEVRHVSASENGFVWAAYHAYSSHHHLYIRPEDIWFSILTQMSFFINANAEELRAFFVEHEGQKHLEAWSGVPEFDELALKMTEIISKNVIDPELRDWVMPSFSTTTVNDKVVGAVLFMGAMQKYFSYGFTLTCGLPSVTLLGELDDWKEISRRLDKIDVLGEEPKQFSSMLRPILQHMILTFEDPTSSQVTDFWNTILHRHHVGSGTDYLSGWLTAFCFWNVEGQAKPREEENTQFGGVEYPTVEIDDIPSGVASVPVRVNDYGRIYQATMIAGSVGIAASHTDVQADLNREPDAILIISDRAKTDNESREANNNTVQPVSGWWICENDPPEEEARKEEEQSMEKRKILKEILKYDEEHEIDDRESEAYRVYMANWTRLEELEELEAY